MLCIKIMWITRSVRFMFLKYFLENAGKVESLIWLDLKF